MFSELHPEPRSAIETVAVGEFGQAGVDGNLAVERIFVVIPVIAAAGADTAPGAVIRRGEVHTRHIGLVAIEELIIKVGDAIEIGTGQLAGTILPGVLVIGGKLEMQSFPSIAIMYQGWLGLGMTVGSVIPDRRQE
jgi:hypothetical protein